MHAYMHACFSSLQRVRRLAGLFTPLSLCVYIYVCVHLQFVQGGTAKEAIDDVLASGDLAEREKEMLEEAVKAPYPDVGKIKGACVCM